MTYMATLQHKKPCPGGHELYYFSSPFLGHIISINLHLFCLIYAWEFKETMHFHYMAYMATPQHKNPVPDVMKFTILVDLSFVIITISCICLNLCPGVYRFCFTKKHQFYTFYPKITSPRSGAL